jgi:hypothetical protein
VELDHFHRSGLLYGPFRGPGWSGPRC